MMRIPSRRRGQALIEAATLIPILVGLVFLAVTFFSFFTRETAYSRAASTLAEWIGRTGSYDPALMCPRVGQMLDEAIGTSTDLLTACAGSGASSDVFLHIAVYEGDCDPTTVCTLVDEIGSPLTSTLLQAPAEAPTGAWTTPLSVPLGSRVSVDIWGYQRIIALNEATGFWVTPIGHAVALSGQENVEEAAP